MKRCESEIQNSKMKWWCESEISKSKATDSSVTWFLILGVEQISRDFQGPRFHLQIGKMTNKDPPASFASETKWDLLFHWKIHLLSWKLPPSNTSQPKFNLFFLFVLLLEPFSTKCCVFELICFFVCFYFTRLNSPVSEYNVAKTSAT